MKFCNSKVGKNNFKKIILKRIIDIWLKELPLKRKTSPRHHSKHGNKKASCRHTEKTASSDNNQTPTSRKIKKYDKNYLSFGFRWCGEQRESKLQCVICYEKFSNHSMKPSLFQCHLNNKHAFFYGKAIQIYRRKKLEMYKHSQQQIHKL